MAHLLTAVLQGIKEAIPRFGARGSGYLVNIASGAGKIGFAGGATGCGSKHFVVGVSEVLRSELHGSGVPAGLFPAGLCPLSQVSALKRSPRALGVPYRGRMDKRDALARLA